MTADPGTVSCNADLIDAMNLMDELGCRHLPVIDQGRLVGVLSDRDILEATGWLSEPPREGAPQCVEDVMTTPPITIGPEDGIAEATIEILTRGIGCLPVVTEGCELVGILTEMDLLNAFANLVDTDLSPSADPTVGERMTDHLVLAGPQTSVREAIELCQAHSIRHLPVVRHGQLKGLLSDRDLRRALGSNLSLETPVDELMSAETLTLDPGEPLTRAARLMVRFRISSLPIVDQGELRGILTSTDILDHCGPLLTAV